VKTRTAPLARVTVPVKVPPEVAEVLSLERLKRRFWGLLAAAPAAPTLHAPETEKLFDPPAQVIVAAVTDVAAVPVFEMVMKLPVAAPQVKVVPVLVDTKPLASSAVVVTAT